MMIPWKYTSDFDTQKHLFFEKIEMGDVVETYICSCGRSEFIVKKPQQKLTYHCPQCENEVFYDANGAWENLTKYVPQSILSELPCEYITQHDASHITAQCSMNIPVDTDFLNKEVIWAKKALYSLRLTPDGEVSKVYEIEPKEGIKLELKKRILHQINANNPLRADNLVNQETDLARISFILENKPYRGWEFHYWEDMSIFTADIDTQGILNAISNSPTKESVKKAVYQNYLRQIHRQVMFNDFFIELFTRKIQDTNILVKFLDLEPELTLYADAGFPLVIDFLKLHYSEYQLFELFKEASATREDAYLFQKSILEFQFYIELKKENFQKVPCTTRALYDEITKEHRRDRYKHTFNQKITYTKQALKSCVQVDGYEVRLPQTGKALYDWSDYIYKELASDFEKIVEGKTTIYGFFKNGSLEFSVKVEDGDIVETKKKYDALHNHQEHETLSKWVKINDDDIQT